MTSYPRPSFALALFVVACNDARESGHTTARGEPASSVTVPVDAGTDTKKGPPETPYEPLRWPDFPGPKVAPAKADIVWAVAPVHDSRWKSSLGIFRAEEARIDGTDVVVKGVRGDVFVPGPSS